MLVCPYARVTLRFFVGVHSAVHLRFLLASIAVATLLSGARPALAAVHVGDTLRVTVAGFSDLSRSAIVDADGRVSLPLIGNVRVAGHELSDIASVLRGMYAKYLRDPAVDVIYE